LGKNWPGGGGAYIQVSDLRAIMALLFGGVVAIIISFASYMCNLLILNKHKRDAIMFFEVVIRDENCENS
jgi:hypothetical protein